ncbi:carbon-nitrogen hydrolase family protein [Stutzerimonas tarimensis]|uniref:Carbon-nitrogen hydrolase family protein n=1 Tax=Stutzerimonas tarimensis TaxID=1507735 RepID=A0ABV7T626_9GAMM
MASQVRIALVQMAIDEGDCGLNLARIEAEIAALGPLHDLLVFPETSTSGFASRAEVEACAEPLDGPLVQRLRELAQLYCTSLAIGLPICEGGALYNCAVLIDPEGVRLVYRKTHLWGDDRAIFEPGHELRVCQWRGIGVGLLICFDIEFPEPARALAEMGAQLLLVCNGNMAPYGYVHRTAGSARAQENQVFVAMCNRAGQGRRDRFDGESMVIDPFGKVLGCLQDQPGHLSLCLDLDDLQRSRATYDYLKERRLSLAEPNLQGCLRLPGSPV